MNILLFSEKDFKFSKSSFLAAIDHIYDNQKN